MLTDWDFDLWYGAAWARIEGQGIYFYPSIHDDSDQTLTWREWLKQRTWHFVPSAY